MAWDLECEGSVILLLKRMDRRSDYGSLVFVPGRGVGPIRSGHGLLRLARVQSGSSVPG
jgi:hypothetical protein